MSFVSAAKSSPKVGYARVSLQDPDLGQQTEALITAGCLRVFKDLLPGAKTDSPGLGEALDYLREGDTLVVVALERLGRSMQHLMELVHTLEEKKVHLLVLQDGIDTSTTHGKVFFQVMGTLARFEREVVRERTQAGLKAARARGRNGGRKASLTSEQQKLALELLNRPDHRIREIADLLGVSERTLFRLKKRTESSKSIE